MGNAASNEIYVNGRFLSQPLSGVQRYAEEVLNALDSTSIAKRLVVLTPRNIQRLPDWGSIRVRKVGGLTGHAWEQVELPLHAKGLLLNFVSSGPIVKRNQIVTFHDAAIFDRPELFSKGYVKAHRILRPLLARRARKIITVSQFSLERLADTLGVSRERFEIIPNGCEHVLAVEAKPHVLANAGLKPGRYGLCVGATPNKNLVAAVRAFEAAGVPDFKIAAVGAKASGVFAEGQAVDRPWFVRLGRVDDGELRALYENAAFFAFPSRYEGFGIPPLEAMRLGCAVIANRSSAIVDTVGDAAILVDVDDVAAFAEAIRSVCLTDRREELIQAGNRRASQFTWATAAEKWISLIDFETKNANEDKAQSHG